MTETKIQMLDNHVVDRTHFHIAETKDVKQFNFG